MELGTAFLNLMINSRAILELHDERTRLWHTALPNFAEESSSLASAIEQQHFANFQLWHEEDKARIPGAPDHQIAAIKRSIDKLNQRRNDLMESCDLFALAELEMQNLPRPDAPLHSESLGLMIDRLSILALKIFHTRQEIERADAPRGHAERNQERLATLTEQRSDLASALDALWSDILAGRKRFKIYRQLKMYNEPSLNPQIYKPSTR
jgi:hypothetical protein